MSRRIAARPPHALPAAGADPRRPPGPPHAGDGREEADRLRAAVYGPSPDAAAVERLRALRAPVPEHRAERPRSGRGRGRVVVLAALVAAALGFGLGWTTRPTPQTPQQLLQARVLGSRGALSAGDYQRIYPGGLPSDWAGAGAGASRRGIRGARVLHPAVSDASSRLLIVPTCAAVDRWVDWTLTGRDGRALGSGRSPCGRFDGQVANFSADDRAAGLALEVVPAGPQPFAVTVYEQ